jgi:hypothetical protein
VSARQKGREVVAEVVEAESLVGFQPNVDLNRCGRIFSFAIMLALSGVLPFILIEGKTDLLVLHTTSPAVPAVRPACHQFASVVILRV